MRVGRKDNFARWPDIFNQHLIPVNYAELNLRILKFSDQFRLVLSKYHAV